MSKYHSITRSCELRNARVSWKPKGVMGSWKQRDDMGVGLDSIQISITLIGWERLEGFYRSLPA